MIDVATSLGLSRATVSLAVRGNPRIPAETRDLVLAEADRLGYVYDRGAAKLRTRRSDLVAMIMPDIVNPFVGEASLGVREVLGRHGLSVVIANTTDDVADQARVLQAMIEERVAGIVMITALGTPDDHLSGLRRSGIPVVLLTRDLPTSPWPFVGSADRTIGRIGAEHLIGVHGCRRVAYLGGHADASPRRLRSDAFRRTSRKHGALLAAEWSVAFDADFATAHRSASALLDAGPPPDGLLCHSDSVAFGLLRALHEHGVGPERCRVLGIDDVAESAFRTPSVSSIAVDAVAQGRRCAALLLDAVQPGAGQAFGDRYTVPGPELIARESCGCG